MKLIYDIVLNFNPTLYDFYEWNTNDNIYHIKKIPIFKLSNKDYLNIKNNTVKLEKEFINQIKDKTKIYRNNQSINYSFLISNELEVTGIKLNKKGINTNKSSLLYDEEEDILCIVKNIEPTNIKYKIIKINKNKNFKTRKELEKQKQVTELLNTLYKEKNKNKLKYLYLECFEKTENNTEKIIIEFKKEIQKNTKNYNKIIDFFKITKKG